MPKMRLRTAAAPMEMWVTCGRILVTQENNGLCTGREDRGRRDPSQETRTFVFSSPSPHQVHGTHPAATVQLIKSACYSVLRLTRDKPHPSHLAAATVVNLQKTIVRRKGRVRLISEVTPSSLQPRLIDTRLEKLTGNYFCDLVSIGLHPV